MRKSEAVNWFGNGSKLAKALGVGKAAVSKWPEDEVPPRCQYEIERLTGGELKADWPPADRPQMVVDEARTGTGVS